MAAWTRARLARLRVRLGLMVFGGVIVLGLGFYGLLLLLTRQWLLQELDSHGRTVTALLAERAAGALRQGDAAQLATHLAHVMREPDLIGIAVYRANGAPVMENVRTRQVWAAHAWSPSTALRHDSLSVHAHGLGRGGVIEMIAPLLVSDAGSGATGARDPSPGEPGAAPARRRVGWVRVMIGTGRIDAAVGQTARVGLTLVLGAFVLWLIPISALFRITVQPLHEAAGLAREIAAGNLDRRIPVRSDDELGALAGSLNQMAAGLAEARRRAKAEEDTLRIASEAVVAIARAARAAADPGSVFGILAPQVRRLTGCRGVALATTSDTDPVLRIVQLDPPPPWGDLAEGVAVDPAVRRRITEGRDAPLRLLLAGDESPFARGLARDGFQSALIVPLGSEAAPDAALILVASAPGAFAPAEVDVVAGLATHLSSALHASRLRERLERSFSELQRARDQLVRAERLRVAGEMASGVAHEFNNVLAAILGRAQLLQRAADRGTIEPGTLARSLEVIERAARDGGETVRRLRQFGDSGESGRSDLVDLDAALREAAEFTRARWQNEAQAAGREIAVTFDSQPGAWVKGRASELREVFTNLILNAIDALPGGGRLRLHTRVENGTVRAAVEDSGRGMDEETRRRVFDPFFTTKGERGTGLGLSMTYGIVQRHGGRIRIESEPDRGTQVRLSFPLASAPVPDTALPVFGPPAVATVALDVLVVDDEQPVRDLLVEMLAACGHRAAAYAAATQALAAFRPGAFDLVLTDLGMPGMTGWQFARAVRAQDPAVHIAFITGWGEEVGADAVREAGADTVVTKPFDIADIEGLAREAAGQRAARRAA